MSKYEELSQQYGKYLAAEQAYIGQVSGVAGNVADGFAGYLGLERRDGVVRLGIGTEHNFEEVTWLGLSSTNKVVNFSIAVTMKDPADFGRTTHVVFELGVSRSGGVYTFNIKTFPDPVLISDLEVSERQFNPIYELLSDRLLRIYDPQRYLA